MRTNHSTNENNDCKSMPLIKEELNGLLGKEVVVDSKEGTQKGNQKIKTCVGILLSVSSNIFSIRMALGKTGHLVKSFLLSDISIYKVIVKEKECC